jgi:zinc protease
VFRPAGADEAPAVESFTLKNGMQVVLIVSHRVPAVTHMLWYRVGAGDDFPGRSGLALYNEHMMFQGTTTMAGGEFARTVARHGGRSNAFTGHDYTAYYVSIAKEYLPEIMQMEADRMLHLLPTPENFLKEREVIIEERRMSIENKPDALLSEEMQAALFRNHPYHTPNIGWMHEMQALTREDVLAFHTQFYHPCNVVLVVAGDITRAELEPMAEKYPPLAQRASAARPAHRHAHERQRARAAVDAGLYRPERRAGRQGARGAVVRAGADTGRGRDQQALPVAGGAPEARHRRGCGL